MLLVFILISLLSLCKSGSQDTKLYTWFFGEMSDRRKANLESIRKNSGLDVVFVNEKNLDSFIDPQYPLHPAYKYLSLIQQGDYLKAYFMNIYGGGYSDIKNVS